MYRSMRPTAGNINLFFTRETFKKVTKIKFSAESTLKHLFHKIMFILLHNLRYICIFAGTKFAIKLKIFTMMGN